LIGVYSRRKPFRCEREDQQMEFVMTGRSMLLASALMAVGGVWAGSASAAPIHADMSLQGGAVFEQVQMRGHGGGGSGMSFSRGGGGGMSFGRSGGGGNFAASRQSFAATNRPGNWSGGNNWNGRRNFADGRHHRRGFRGPFVAFGPGYYDYGYDYGYYPYDDDAYAYVAPGPDVTVGDNSVAYCQQRFRSYDPSTGTYLGNDGLRHPCP
jgi:BA14K-like protein